MKTEARNLKINDVFTESGITVRITNIEQESLVNGKESYSIEAISIDYNKKMYRNLEMGLPCHYHKKADTIVSVKN